MNMHPIFNSSLFSQDAASYMFDRALDTPLRYSYSTCFFLSGLHRCTLIYILHASILVTDEKCKNQRLSRFSRERHDKVYNEIKNLVTLKTIQETIFQPTQLRKIQTFLQILFIKVKLLHVLR